MGQSCGDGWFGAVFARQRNEPVCEGIPTCCARVSVLGVTAGCSTTTRTLGTANTSNMTSRPANFNASERLCIVACCSLVLPVDAHNLLECTRPRFQQVRSVQLWLELLANICGQVYPGAILARVGHVRFSPSLVLRTKTQ